MPSFHNHCKERKMWWYAYWGNSGNEKEQAILKSSKQYYRQRLHVIECNRVRWILEKKKDFSVVVKEGWRDKEMNISKNAVKKKIFTSYPNNKKKN